MIETILKAGGDAILWIADLVTNGISWIAANLGWFAALIALIAIGAIAKKR